MEYNSPTTKAEMYEILKAMYAFYRLKKPTYQGADLGQLSLTRLSFTPLSDEALSLRAAELLKGEKEKDIKEATEKTQEEIMLSDEKYAILTARKTTILNEIDEEYSALSKKIKKSGEKTGVKTDYVFDRLAALEREKQEKIKKSVREIDEEMSENRARKNVLVSRLGSLSDYYDDIYAAKIQSKKEELKAAQEATEREIFKYNNGLDEKEQRYANQLVQSQATLEIKYLEVTREGYTKEQLVEMGYYADVIDCVCDYYDTLEAVAAYNDIKNETGIMTYLDDYYERVIYIYRTRAL